MVNLTKEIQVHATLETTFAALLEQLGLRMTRRTASDAEEDRTLARRKVVPTWATETAISGDWCRPSSGRRLLEITGRCSCPIRRCRMCNTA